MLIFDVWVYVCTGHEEKRSTIVSSPVAIFSLKFGIKPHAISSSLLHVLGLG